MSDELYQNTLYARFVSIITQSLDIEVSRLIVEEQQEKVLEYLNKKYYNARYYQFFTPAAAANLIDEILEDAILRDFTMDLTRRVISDTVLQDINYNEVLEKTVMALKYATSQVGDEYQIMNEAVAKSIELDEETMRKTLMANPLLVVMYYSLMYFSNTSIYRALLERS